MRKSCLTLILWAVMAASSFAASLPGFVLAAQTQHFSFYSRGGAAVDAPRTEKRVAELEKLFDQPLAHHASYYRYATEQEVAAGTGYYASGVTFAAAGEVHSTQAFHDHELVHLVAGQLGNPGPFFQEGLAVAVGNKGQGRSADKVAKGHAGEVVRMVVGFDRFDPSAAYAVAGSFVSYLVRTHGMPAVVSFFRGCGTGADVNGAFAAAFGGTLETLATAWQRSL